MSAADSQDYGKAIVVTTLGKRIWGAVQRSGDSITVSQAHEIAHQEAKRHGLHELVGTGPQPTYTFVSAAVEVIHVPWHAVAGIYPTSSEGWNNVEATPEDAPIGVRSGKRRSGPPRPQRGSSDN